MIFGKGRFLRAADRLEASDPFAALSQLERYLERDPDDVRVLRRAGELAAEIGENERAVGHYAALVGAFVQNGLGLKAIAASRALLELDPDHFETQAVLAKLASDRGLTPESVLTPAMKRSLAPPSIPEEEDDVLDPDALGVLEEDALDADELIVAETVTEGVALADIPLFSDLEASTFVDLVRTLELWRVPVGNEIIQQGADGASFFVIVSGSVRVEREHKGDKEMVGRLKSGDFFGEIAALAGLPRTATVSALEETELLEVNRAALEQLQEDHPEVADVLERYKTKRLIDNAMQAPVFAGLSLVARDEVVGGFEGVRVSKDERVLVEGEDTDGLYIVLAGELAVARDDDEIALLHSGDIFGEMGLFFGEPANATVSALTEAKVLRLSADDFAGFCDKFPELKSQLESLTEERLKSL